MPGRHRFRRIATLREILGRSRRARTPVATAPTSTISFADGPIGIAHRVTDEAFAAGRPEPVKLDGTSGGAVVVWCLLGFDGRGGLVRAIGKVVSG